MPYPQEFAKRVKAEYPENTTLHKLIDAGSYEAGLELRAALETLTCEEVLTAIEAGRVAELKERCQTYIRRKNLYYEWCRIYISGKPAVRIQAVFMRHTETEWNAQGRLQGQTDTVLSDAGRAHAEMMVWELSRLNIGRIVSSDLARASETATIIGKRLGVPVVIDERLRECSFGSLEGMTLKEIANNYGQDAASYTSFDYDFSPFGAENREQVLARHNSAIKDALNAFARHLHLHLPKNRILFVGHGNGLNTLLSSLGHSPDLKRREYRLIELEAADTRS